MQSSLGVKTLLQDPSYTRPSTSTQARQQATTKPRSLSAPTRPIWQNPNALPSRPPKKYTVSLHHTPIGSRVSDAAPYGSRKILGSPTRAQATRGRPYLLDPYNPLSDPHLSKYYARKFESASHTKIYKSPQKTRRRKASGVVYKLVVRTDSRKNAGTDANVFVELKGTKGMIGKTRLFHKPEGKSSYLYEPPFAFQPGSEETFTLRGPDIGDIKLIMVEHDGLDRKQGWFLLEMLVRNTRNKKVWTFPCFQWLSLFESDCQIKRQLQPNKGTQRSVKTVYEIMVETGDVRGAGTDAKVYMILFGSKGQTAKVLLANRDKDNFERGKTDRFKIKSTSLGALKKLIVEHDNTGFGPGWFLHKVTVTELVKGTVIYFPCDQWLDKDEGDGKVRRQLMAAKRSTDQRKGFKYKVCTYTGNVRGAGTDANVAITIFGENGDTGEHCLDNSRNNFEKGRMDAFGVEAVDLGELTKVRIGHDNRGAGPGWFLDKITVEDESRGKVFEFPCHRWLAKDEDDRQITRELVCTNGSQSADMYITPGVPYQLHITTGDVRNASTSANVFVVLYGGEDGEKNSGKLVLRNEKNDNFKRGRSDIFNVETVECLSPFHHITIGHDNSGLGAGWHCEKVEVDCPSTGCKQVFLCQQWIADDEGDGRLERDLFESEDMRQKRKPKIVYNVWVSTSNERGAGTDANVFLTIYGKKGKTDEIQIGNATDNFEQGQLDKFKVELANVGPLYKLRIRHDNAKPFSDWHLEKIQVENVKTGLKYSFKCGRWLSLKEDDKSLVRELPAVGEGIEALPVLIYQVSVHTGKKSGAGTDANVFLNIFGKQGDTGERPLMFSKNNRNKFEKGDVDQFDIEAVKLQALEKIRVGHDGSGPGAGWFLDKIVITDPNDPTKDFNFPCERWLAKDEDDGQIIRELSLGGTSLLQTTSYKVTVRTGDVRGAGTDANVYVQIFGKNGDTGKLPLRQSENTKNKFERGRADLFTVEAVDIGKLDMVRIGHDGKGFGSGWYLDEVKVEVPSHGQIIVFPCHRWLAEDEDDGLIERELYPGQQNITEQKIPYEVVVHTGDVRGAGTDANVILVLYGEKGKSDEFKLRNKTDNFERAKVEKFKVESEDIGPITKIRIGHDNAGFGAAWFLDKVEVSRIKDEEDKPKKKKKKKRTKSELRASDDEEDGNEEENDYEYLFLCNRWLAKNEDDGEIMRELVPSNKSGLKRQNTLSENTYVIHVYTGDVLHAGTNANVLITIFGENGDSGERKLNKSEKHMDKFERNQEDIFTIKCITLGSLSKLKIRHDNSGVKAAWFLNKVEIEDKLKAQRYAFPCDRWLATGEDDGQISRELPALTAEDFNAEQKRKMIRKQSSKALVDSLDLESKARLTSYEVLVGTGDVSGAGTDANVYIILYGEKGETGKIDLKTSKTNKDKFEKDQTDVFSIDADVGALTKIRIGHDNKGGFAGWFLDKLEIDSRSLGKKWMFPCGRWLDKGKDDGMLERELYPIQDAEQAYIPHVPYEITVYTGDVSGAGTGANIFVVVYGVELNTGECVLAETKKKKKSCFERSSVDQFVKELVDVGDVIEKIRIGHDGKGIGAGWFLEKVEIRRLLEDNKSATLYTLPCHRWLAKGEDDGAIVRELVPKDVTEELVDKHGEVTSNKVDHQALDVRKYRVHVFTGDVKGAGTDANVFVTLFGQYGDSGERQLSKSETHTDKFERAKEDIFTFEAADLGNIHKAKLRHDNAMMNPAWYVDRVEVVDMAIERKFVFHCERWLAKNKEDKKIERTLYEKEFKGDRSSVMTGLSMDSKVDSTKSRISLGTLDSSVAKKRSTTADEIFDKEFKEKKKKNEPTKSISYTVRATTGEQTDAGTEAKVYVVLIGTQAATDKIDLELVQKAGFEPGTAETFSVEAVDVGEVKKIEVGHYGYSQKDGWYLKEIEIDVPTRGKVYHFSCNRWLAKDKEDGLTVRVLSVNESELVSYKPHIPYEITVFTGDVKDAGTDCQITMTLYGSEGATPEINLEKGDEKFERGAVDMFRMELDDVGKLRKMRIGHDSKGNRPSWHLDKVIVRNDDTGSVSVFKCNDWLSKTMGDGQLSKELPAITEGEKTLGNTTYKVNVITGDVMGSGTDANVFLIIFGEHGDSGEIPLKNSETYKDKFERGHTDVFVLKDILSLGELTKVRVWHDNKFLKASWFLERIDIEDESSKKVYKFSCDRWLGKDKDDGSLLRELPCSNRDETVDSPVAVFEITLLTSDKQNAGTNQNASLLLIGEKRKSQVYSIENSPKKKHLRRGQTDTFKFVTKPLGALQEVIVGHHPKPGSNSEKSGKEQAWYLHEVIVKNTDNGEKFVFPCRQWIPLTANKKDGVRLECKSSERSRLATIRELKPIQYEVAVCTADVAHAGTDANVSITVYGENGDSGQRKLTKKMVNLFERGQRDVFTVEALDLGQLKMVRIEHDNKGFGAAWKLDKVEITHLTSSEMVLFPCNQWFDKKEGDGLICRDLVPSAAS